MRNTVGHNDDVAFGDLPRLPIADTAAAEFVGRRGLRVNGFAAGDEGCRSIEHVDHVCVSRVDLSLSRLLAPTSMDHIIAAIAAVKEYRPLSKGFLDFALVPIRHRR